MPTCPNGHQSGSEDWCEVCGHRMGGAMVPPPPPPPPYAGGYPPHEPGGPGPAGEPQLCPQCRTPREPMAPFCEECRWNYLTNTATSYTPIAPPHRTPGGRGPDAGGGLNPPPGFPSQPPRPPDPYEYQGSRPSQVNRPAEPLMSQTPPRGPLTPSFDDQAPPFETQAPPFENQVPPFAPQAPGFPHQAPPAPPAPPGEDDWMLPPPSQRQPLHHPGGPGPITPGPARWAAVIGPDRDYFLAMMQRSGPEATGLNLPAYSPEQRMTLSGNQVTIGRRRHSTGESPDIDLSVPPEDPGVSHQHAVLVQQPDGSWAVVDQNSTNGTTLNGGEEPIQPYVPIPLNDGDRVHVGAWTTIRIVRG